MTVSKWEREYLLLAISDHLETLRDEGLAGPRAGALADLARELWRGLPSFAADDLCHLAEDLAAYEFCYGVVVRFPFAIDGRDKLRLHKARLLEDLRRDALARHADRLAKELPGIQSGSQIFQRDASLWDEDATDEHGMNGVQH